MGPSKRTILILKKLKRLEARPTAILGIGFLRKGVAFPIFCQLSISRNFWRIVPSRDKKPSLQPGREAQKGGHESDLNDRLDRQHQDGHGAEEGDRQRQGDGDVLARHTVRKSNHVSIAKICEIRK